MNYWIALTTPFWTLKPSWYFVSGLFIFTSTTGAQGTTVSFTTVWVLEFWNQQTIHILLFPLNKTFLFLLLKMENDYCHRYKYYLTFDFENQIRNLLEGTDLDVVLTGGERQADQTDTIDCDDLVSDVELTAPRRCATRRKVGNHYRGQHGAPAWLHYHHTQYLPLRLGHYHLQT